MNLLLLDKFQEKASKTLKPVFDKLLKQAPEQPGKSEAKASSPIKQQASISGGGAILKKLDSMTRNLTRSAKKVVDGNPSRQDLSNQYKSTGNDDIVDPDVSYKDALRVVLSSL